ncbi:Frizzled-8-like protein [Leptotrombidium deliense]|uniref:Frizzled-8-like protein n=1 Tax=Leptotrombidium deliense TaxID=299467 RepID=A0A443SPA9_9ACAR|nr:Frizzled-8-like protein [Leptotrombidium deliense]
MSAQSLLACVLFALSAKLCFGYANGNEKERCEEITIPMCRGIGYNYTSMPNQFHHDTQEEAGLEVHQFWPLVEIQCSDDLRFFLCSMYTPICIDDYHGRLPACRSVCDRAKSGCAPIMRQYGFAWPERMNCEDLPPYGDQDHLCMDSKEGAAPAQTVDNFASVPSSISPTVTKATAVKEQKERTDRTRYKANRNYKGNRQDHRLGANKPPTAVLNADLGSSDCRCECKKPMITFTDAMDRKYYNRVETGSVINCLKPCNSVFFPEKQQSLAALWVTVFAIACAVTTSLTVLTFITDPERFRYPERSIIYLSACYLMVSIGFIVRSWIGHKPIACEDSMIRYQATGPGAAACVTVFLLIYFFGMASSVWWVILTLTWFLAAGLKWGNEAIAGYSQYFHLVAWFVPTVKSIIILAMGAIDGDSFTGICYVGNQDLNNLKNFVLIPLCVYLGLGFVFLLAGFISLFRIRSVIRQQARAKADKLEKLMIRIVISSILYIVPGSIVIACYFYEFYNREKWEKTYNCRCVVPPLEPYYFVFLLKYIACLIVGITSSFWIWSGKTIESWSRFYGRLCCGTSSSSSRSGASQLIIGSQYIGNNQRTYKQMSNQQQAYSSASHIAHLPHSAPHSKQLPLSHV